MKNLGICIICTAIVVILDIIVSKKILRALFDYSGITFGDMQNHFADNDIDFPSNSSFHGRRHSMRYRQRAITEYISQYAVDVDSSMYLFNLYKYSTLPIPIATSFVLFERIADNYIYILIAYAVLLLVVIGFWIALWSFKRKHPIDEIELEKLEEKRSGENNKQFMPARVFVIVISIIPIIAMVLVLGNVGKGINIGSEPKTPSYAMTTTPHSPDKLGILAFLDERGFWTKDQIAHYHDFETEKFTNAFASRKDDNSFEYYEYSDEKAAQALFSKIIEDCGAQDKITDDTHYVYEDENEFIFVSREGNTVIYAYSYNGGADIKDALTACGIYSFE